MPEEIALEQFTGQARATHRDEGIVALATAAGELAGEHALAGAAGTENGNVGRRVRRFERNLDRALRGRIRGFEVDGWRLGGEFALERPDARLQRARLLDLGKDAANLIRRKWLRHEV